MSKSSKYLGKTDDTSSRISCHYAAIDEVELVGI